MVLVGEVVVDLGIVRLGLGVWMLVLVVEVGFDMWLSSIANWLEVGENGLRWVIVLDVGKKFAVTSIWSFGSDYIAS